MMTQEIKHLLALQAVGNGPRLDYMTCFGRAQVKRFRI